MTRRISISLPDDIAERLDHEENASAYIAEAIRLRVRRESLGQVLVNAGYRITPEGKERMRRRLQDAEKRRTERHEAA